MSTAAYRTITQSVVVRMMAIPMCFTSMVGNHHLRFCILLKNFFVLLNKIKQTYFVMYVVNSSFV